MELTEHLTTYPSLTTALHDTNLQSKSVLITGGGHGIGADIARSFAERKVSHIILVGRTESKLQDTASSLSSGFPSTKVSYHTADISSNADVDRLFNSLGEEAPDFLINNAGYLPQPASFIDADLGEWWTGFTINVLGTALVTQKFLLHRRTHATTPSREPAVIVTLNTIGAYSVRVPQLSAYGASKAALIRWSELASVDVPETEARFVSVHPGAVDTAMGTKSGLNGVFPMTEGKLAAEFIVWVTGSDASFLAGRFVWVNWDVQELLANKEKIVSEDLLRSSLST
jgi:NAD(P)-dependent dehydrogenase (short-subunit alcohol dehydrogenase family)